MIQLFRDFLIALSLQVPFMWSMGRQTLLLGHDYWFFVMASPAIMAGNFSASLCPLRLSSFYIRFSLFEWYVFHAPLACRGNRWGAWFYSTPYWRLMTRAWDDCVSCSNYFWDVNVETGVDMRDECHAACPIFPWKI